MPLKLLFVLFFLGPVEAILAESTKAGTAALLASVDGYYSALEAKSLEQMATVVDPDLIVLEGTHKNVGWADYKEHHIGPEMKEWTSFKTRDRKVVFAQDNDSLGYVIEELSYDIVLPKGKASMLAADTFVLGKTTNGRWRIKHVHSSAKRAH